MAPLELEKLLAAFGCWMSQQTDCRVSDVAVLGWSRFAAVYLRENPPAPSMDADEEFDLKEYAKAALTGLMAGLSWVDGDRGNHTVDPITAAKTAWGAAEAMVSEGKERMAQGGSK